MIVCPEASPVTGSANGIAALGNHRAVIRVTQPAEAVSPGCPGGGATPSRRPSMSWSWTRRPARPWTNSVVATCNREYGEVVFEPTSGPGLYYAYYLMPTP